MFLQWVSKCELVPTQADSHVLKVRGLDGGRCVVAVKGVG
jgi:hypothetical protein